VFLFAAAAMTCPSESISSAGLRGRIGGASKELVVFAFQADSGRKIAFLMYMEPLWLPKAQLPELVALVRALRLLERVAMATPVTLFGGR